MDAPASHTSPSRELLNLQQSAGNAAVLSLLVGAQAKLIVGAANDPFEREADTVADQVLARLHDGARAQRHTVDKRQHFSHLVRLQRQRRSSRALPEVGREGGELQADTQASLRTLQGGGRPLAVGLRIPLERAFGADFRGVRLHRGPASEELCSRLGAEAFTVNNRIFLGKATPSLERPAGQRLLAHELTHTIQQGSLKARGGATTQGPARVSRMINAGMLVQRAFNYGVHEPAKLITKDSPDLLYGINIPRASTKAKLSGDQRVKLRTIDDYNRAIGVNGVMKSATAAMGLFTVRTALNASGAWNLPRDNKFQYDKANDDAVQKWIDFLRAHKDYIGLVDLAQRGTIRTPAKIDQKGRFKKNRKESQAKDSRGERLTSRDTRQFLGQSDAKAAGKTFAAMPSKKQQALNEWIYRAFFRRTSKLGQDFVIKELGGKVHFNTVSDPNYDPMKPGGPTWEDHGLVKQATAGDNRKNRAITVSEYRHMQKLLQQDPSLAGKFNAYGEI